MSMSGYRVPMRRPTTTCPRCCPPLVSKVPVFGLLVGTYSCDTAPRSARSRAMSWDGLGCSQRCAGAMLAVRQDDMKRMLAYSSMSQLGYIITAIALMSHLGWVTALYLAANHLMVKGISVSCCRRGHSS